MWREEGTDQNKHLVVVTYFTVFRLPEWGRNHCEHQTGTQNTPAESIVMSLSMFF
jgi:hypothetical protein